MEFKGSDFADIHIRLISRKRTADHLNENNDNDVKVITEFPAHRGLLASFSPWFHKKLLWPVTSVPCAQELPSRHAKPDHPSSGPVTKDTHGLCRLADAAPQPNSHEPLDLGLNSSPVPELHQPPAGNHAQGSPRAEAAVPSVTADVADATNPSLSQPQALVHEPASGNKPRSGEEALAPVSEAHQPATAQPSLQNTLGSAGQLAIQPSHSPAGSQEQASTHAQPTVQPGSSKPEAQQQGNLLLPPVSEAVHRNSVEPHAQVPACCDVHNQTVTGNVALPFLHSGPPSLGAPNSPDMTNAQGQRDPGRSFDAHADMLDNAQPHAAMPGAARPHITILDIATTEEDAVLIQTMIAFMYARQQEGTALKPAGTAANLLQPLSQSELLSLLLLCDYYSVKSCVVDAAAALASQAMLISTVAGVYALPDSLAQQDHMQPVLARAKDKLLVDYQDLECSLADDASMQAFRMLPLKAVIDILQHSETRVVSEDTAAAAVCEWMAQQPWPVSQEEQEELLACLRLQHLSHAFRTLIPCLPAYKPLHDYMQHPSRSKQLDFWFTWCNSKLQDIMLDALDFEFFKGFPFSSKRPSSCLSSIILTGRVPATDMKNAVKEIETGQTDKKKFFTDWRSFGAFRWRAALGIADGCVYVYLLVDTWHSSAEDVLAAAPSLLVIRSISSCMKGNHPAKHSSKHFLIELGRYQGYRFHEVCSVSNWQKFVKDGELQYQLTIEGPPML